MRNLAHGGLEPVAGRSRTTEGARALWSWIGLGDDTTLPVPKLFIYNPNTVTLSLSKKA